MTQHKKIKGMVDEAKDVEVKLTPDKSTPQSRTYSNFVRVTQTPYDFSLVFCDATPITIEDGIKGPIVHKIPVISEIAIPFHLVPGLINALQIQYNLYKGRIPGDQNGKDSK